MKNSLRWILPFIIFPLAGLCASSQEHWDSLCAKCHGANGNGKTKEGVKLRIKDYTDPKVQAEFTDTGLLKNLLLGVSTEAGVERLPHYKDKLTIDEAKDLVALIRGFKAK